MMAALALPAAKLALSATSSVVDSVKDALDPAKTKAKKQADDFETMYLEQVTERMFQTSDSSEGPLGTNGTGGNVYKSMMTQQYAKQLQRSGGIGLSDQIMRDLLRVQEQSAPQAAAAAATGGATNVAG